MPRRFPEAPSKDVNLENGIHQGDIFLAQSYIREGSYRPSLSDYLMHAIPRQRYGGSHGEAWPALHIGAAIPCSHHSCNAAEAAVTSVSTEWPLILRMDPIRRIPGMAFIPDTRDVGYPLTLNLGSNVEYRLIARVIYLDAKTEGGIGHYLTKIRLKDSTYIYNDRRHGGMLTELGPLHLLEDHEPKTSFVIYLRTSKASRTLRTVDEIQVDYAKIPIRLPEVVEMQDDSDSADKSHAETDSNTPCPVLCRCGIDLPEGDDDPDEVQCYPGVDWSDSNNQFICEECRIGEDTEFFQAELDTIVILPVQEANWEASEVLWYPASREFLKKTALPGAHLTDTQIGKIRLPFYMNVDHRGHKNLALASTFAAALPPIAAILKSWDKAHSAIRGFNSYSGAGPSGLMRHRKASHWLEAHNLIPNPELEAVLSDSLATLMQHSDLAALLDDELNERVLGVGSALFQLLAVQSELGEPLNLNGDLIADLGDKPVVPYRSDGHDGLDATDAAVPPGTHHIRPSLSATYIFPDILKRQGDQLIDDERPAKRTKTEKRGKKKGGKRETNKNDNQVSTTPRLLRSGKRA
ncbi:hypothetical protein GGX14DRAFT_611425 [Mycena pura]|uniref:Uncharacterized protein n=1 Tax=Mycena pura TaxID=153505 RepID=A0AAD6UK66_9AGAR|nr:hypothetical protein GGX14DRAFT_611425 [Mycena pura]